VLTGRNREKLVALRGSLLAATGAPAADVMTLAFDAADPGQARFGVEAVMREYGRIDILVNNAGSAGPKQPIFEQPLTREELEAQRAAGSTDTETVRDAAGNLLGLAWNMVRAVAPHLGRGSSIINVSTIFSRTKYYGRSAYVMPKAALSALSKQLALQLGANGIRVNTVYPGPIEGPRIRNVFSAMDKVRNTSQGTTTNDFLSVMALSPMSGQASSCEKPGKYKPLGRSDLAVNHCWPRPLMRKPVSVPLRAMAVTTELNGTPWAASMMALHEAME
jgi:malonyl-CoA reductase/3-hydroxypropionate dehydrogenase (NADP+)